MNTDDRYLYEFYLQFKFCLSLLSDCSISRQILLDQFFLKLSDRDFSEILDQIIHLKLVLKKFEKSKL